MALQADIIIFLQAETGSFKAGGHKPKRATTSTLCEFFTVKIPAEVTREGVFGLRLNATPSSVKASTREELNELAKREIADLVSRPSVSFQCSTHKSEKAQGRSQHVVHSSLCAVT